MTTLLNHLGDVDVISVEQITDVHDISSEKSSFLPDIRKAERYNSRGAVSVKIRQSAQHFKKIPFNPYSRFLDGKLGNFILNKWNMPVVFSYSINADPLIKGSAQSHFIELDVLASFGDDEYGFKKSVQDQGIFFEDIAIVGLNVAGDLPWHYGCNENEHPCVIGQGTWGPTRQVSASEAIDVTINYGELFVVNAALGQYRLSSIRKYSGKVRGVDGNWLSWQVIISIDVEFKAYAYIPNHIIEVCSYRGDGFHVTTIEDTTHGVTLDSKPIDYVFRSQSENTWDLVVLYRNQPGAPYLNACIYYKYYKDQMIDTVYFGYQGNPPNFDRNDDLGFFREFVQAHFKIYASSDIKKSLDWAQNISFNHSKLVGVVSLDDQEYELKDTLDYINSGGDAIDIFASFNGIYSIMAGAVFNEYSYNAQYLRKDIFLVLKNAAGYYKLNLDDYLPVNRKIDYFGSRHNRLYIGMDARDADGRVIQNQPIEYYVVELHAPKYFNANKTTNLLEGGDGSVLSDPVKITIRQSDTDVIDLFVLLSNVDEEQIIEVQSCGTQYFT